MATHHADERRPLFDRYFNYLYSRRPSDRFLLVIISAVFAVSLLYAVWQYNESTKTTVATSGGTFVEGIVGTPRFANPVLAITRADQDVVALVYSGLMKLTPAGTIEPDLAESLTVSDDGLVYNLILRENVYFHDGEMLQADDVAYTIGLIQDPLLSSPLRGNWNDVTVEVINDRELNLVLEEPYAPFIENLTVGILPKHLWNDLTSEQIPFSQYNNEPVGTGPYKLDRVTFNQSGLIEAYTLVATNKNGGPNISTVQLRFYQNEESLETAFTDGDLTATAGLSVSALQAIDSKKFMIVEEPLPRLFAIFLNQNKSPALRDQAAREALSTVLDRDILVQEVLYGFGVPSASPIPTGFLTLESSSSSAHRVATTTSDRQAAESILIDGGWERQSDSSWVKEIDDSPVTLSISITSANTGTFERTAEYVRAQLEDLGVKVNIALFEQSDLTQVIIRPRDYEALLFGIDVGRQLDLYPFWHSSQKDDPGLNISNYTNISTDELLETARTTADQAERLAALQSFETEVFAEIPALFLYSPTFTYVVDANVSLTEIDRIVRPHERFSAIDSWYMDEHDVWPFFAN